MTTDTSVMYRLAKGKVHPAVCTCWTPEFYSCLQLYDLQATDPGVTKENTIRQSCEPRNNDHNALKSRIYKHGHSMGSVQRQNFMGRAVLK